MSIATERLSQVSVQVGNQEITFETGKLAKQADGSVVVRSGETMVLATAVGRAEAREGADFFPLTIDVEERMYAAGKIPGGFFKREGRASERATLTARMIDRPIRPLFPKGWNFETQLVSMPLSVDHVHPYDILAMNGASAALMISNIPLPVPVGAVRIGKVEGNFVVFIHIVDAFYLQRAGMDYFQFQAAFSATNNVAFLDIIFFDLQQRFALRTIRHNSSRPLNVLLYKKMLRRFGISQNSWV